MKFVVVFALLVAVCAAAPLSPAAVPGADVAATSLRDIRENNGVDAYLFDFETSNGIKRQESGSLKTIDDNAAIVVVGSASWIAPDGTPVEFKYTADENGYHPVL